MNNEHILKCTGCLARNNRIKELIAKSETEIRMRKLQRNKLHIIHKKLEKLQRIVACAKECIEIADERYTSNFGEALDLIQKKLQQAIKNYDKEKK